MHLQRRLIHAQPVLSTRFFVVRRIYMHDYSHWNVQRNQRSCTNPGQRGSAWEKRDVREATARMQLADERAVDHLFPWTGYRRMAHFFVKKVGLEGAEAVDDVHKPVLRHARQ